MKSHFISLNYYNIHLEYNMETFLLGFVFLAIMFLAVWGLFVKTPRERYEEQVSMEELESPYEEPPLEEIAVTIVKLHCGAKLQGSKTPKAIKEFYAIFQTENGEEIELSVDEESYFSLEENKKGTLALVNGNFYGFCEDE